MAISLSPIPEAPLGKELARHLLGRTTMGAKRSEILAFAGYTITEAMDVLFTVEEQPDPPLQVFGSDPNVSFGESWISASLDGSIRFQRKKSLRSWWIGLLLNQSVTIREKMVLFWHNHFVTETNVVNIPAYLYDYNSLIRQHAFGNFKTLAMEMTTNTAMLRYLDGIKNTVESPNENYSRELFELFTIGKGPLIGEGNYTYYTEQDVQEGARILTGWKVNNNSLSSWFNASKHDKGIKNFSGYYGNQIIADQGDREYQALIHMIFNKKQTARRLVRKLYRWFVYHQIDDQVESAIIEPLSDVLFENGYDVQPVLRLLLSSEHFFDPGFRGCYIKSPLEFIIGSLKKLAVSVPDELDVKYEFWNLFYVLSGNQEQELGSPPDVAGWPSYYLEPGFNELWINSATLPQKAEFTTKLLQGKYKKKSISLQVDVISLAEQLSSPSDPEQLIVDFCELLLPVMVTEEQVSDLKEVLIPGLPDFEWTVEWAEYRTSPDDVNLKKAIENALQLLLEAIMHLPEYYLM